MNLHPYQLEGAAFLADRKWAYIADEPGLGKTAQVICAADWLDIRTIVVICPAFLRTNWTREFAKWSTLGRTVAAWASSSDKPPETDVVCVSYDLAGRSAFKRWFEKRKPELLVCDEAHYLKTRSSKRTIAVFGPGMKGNGLIRHAARTWLVSGTPILNKCDDLYTWLRAFGVYDKGYNAFTDEYTTGFVGDYGYKITGNKNVSRLKEIMAPVLLRRKLEDVAMQLPPITVQSLMVDPLEVNPGLSQLKELEVWERITREVMGHRKDIVEAMKEITIKERNHLLQARQCVGMLKIRSYASVINDELYNWHKDKLVIFGIHRGVLKGLKIFLEGMGHRPGIIWGGTKPEDRDKILDSFQNSLDKKGRVLLCNITAAGVGLNITSARYVDIVEPSWTPAENEQAIKRLHRIGQDKPVVARFVGLAGSIDEYITETLAKKMSMISEIVG